MIEIELLCTPLDRHAGEGISKLCSAIAANLVASAIDGENPAKVAVVTAEEEIQRKHESLHIHSLEAINLLSLADIHKFARIQSRAHHEM